MLKSGEVREISTKDAAVVSNFHGERANGLEHAFSKEEDKFSAALRAIDQGSPLDGHAATLSRMVWSQSLRTRAFRHSIGETVGELFSMFTGSLGSDAAMEAMKRRAKKEIPRRIVEELAKLPPDARREAERRLNAIGGIAGAEQLALANVDPATFSILGALLNAYLKSERVIEREMERAHVKGLSQFLSEPASEKAFHTDTWHLTHDPAGSLILGDMGVFAVAQDRTTSLVTRTSESTWREVYLPISPTTALVACKGDAQPGLSPAEINRASACFSFNSIYASQAPEAIRALIPLIGTRAMIGEPGELQEILDKVWQDKAD